MGAEVMSLRVFIRSVTHYSPLPSSPALLPCPLAPQEGPGLALATTKAAAAATAPFGK